MEITFKFMKENEYKTVEISPDGPRLGFHENYLLADYFALTSLRILGKIRMEFFQKCSNQSLVHTPSPQ